MHAAVLPDATQVLSVQAVGAPHVPVDVQVATALSEAPPSPAAHSVVPGVHTPTHWALPSAPTHA